MDSLDRGETSEAEGSAAYFTPSHGDRGVQSVQSQLSE